LFHRQQLGAGAAECKVCGLFQTWGTSTSGKVLRAHPLEHLRFENRAQQRAAGSSCEENPALPVLFTPVKPLKNRSSDFSVIP
jgi:hypothetical protein